MANQNMQPAEERASDAGRDANRKGKATKKSQAKANQKTKVISIVLIVMLILGSGVSLDAAVLGTQQGQAENTPKTIYETLKIGNLLDLVQIKGDAKAGYYYDFKDGTEEKLNLLVQNLQKEKNKAITKDLLKKMIKAEVVNQFPFLQGSGGVSSYAKGNSIAETVWNFLIENGYTEQAVAGAMGNIHQESGGFNPDIVEDGGSGEGIGLCQWSYGRREKLESYARNMGKQWTDLDLQLQYLLMELQGGSEYAEDGFNGKHEIKTQWENASTPEEAAETFEEGFERASIPMMENRIFWANIYYEQYRGTYQSGNGSGSDSIANLEGVLFIGDSITKGIESYGLTPQGAIVKAEIGWSPSNWLENINSLPTNNDEIKAICIMLGTNNPYQIEGMQELLQVLHDRYPEKQIYVQKSVPLPQAEQQSETYNESIQNYCNSEDFLTYIETLEGIEYEADHVHPTRSGTETLLGNIQSQLGNEGGNSTYLGEFSGTVRIRRVMPNKNIGEMKNTGTGVTTDTTSNETNSATSRQVEDYINSNAASGTWSVYAKNLTANTIKVSVNNQKLESGNLISLFIMATAFEEIEKGNLDKSEVINDITKMVSANDNAATDNMIEKLGFNKINNYIVTNGYRSTQVRRKIQEEPRNGDNYTSVIDVGNLLEKIQRGTCVTPNASQEMIEILKTQILRNRIPAGIPQGVEIVNKAVEANQIQSDAAIVYKDGAYYVLVIIANGINDVTTATNNMKDISSKTYELINILSEGQEEITDSTTTTTAGVESGIYDLKYVEPNVFNQYIESNNRQALKVYTLDENTKKLIVANWSYTEQEGLKIVASEPINFRAVLNKYTMPIEYMIDFLIHTDDPEMVGKLADLAINSEYIIAIQDNITTVKTVVDIQEKNYRITKMPDDTYETSRFQDWHTTSKTVTVSETVSNEIELTYADSWFVKFSKTSSYASMAFNQNAGNDLTANQGELIGDFKTTVYCASCNSPVGTMETDSGILATPNHTIAVHSDYFNGRKANGKLSKGSQVLINGQVYTVEDIGDSEGIFQDNWISIFCEAPCEEHGGSIDSGNGTVPVYVAKNVSQMVGANIENDNKGLKGINTVSGILGEVKDTQTIVEESLGIERTAGETEGVTDVTEKKKITTVRTISNKYNSGKENIEKVEQKFINVFLSSKGILNRFNMNWMESLLEKNEKTVNMIDLTKYLYNRAKNYNTNAENEYNFDVYKRNDLYNIYNSSGILEEFIKSLINNPLRLYMNHHASIDEGEIKNYITANVDEPSYKMLTNQYGGRGFGFDIFHRLNEVDWNSGKPNENRIVEHYEELSFDITPYTNWNQTLETDIVDQVMRKEIEKWRDIIENSTKNKGIELEDYQVDALTAVAYEYGWSEKDTDSFKTAYETYYLKDNKVAFRNNFLIAQKSVQPFAISSDARDYTEKEEQEKRKASLIWNLFDKGEYKTPEGEILDPDSFQAKGDILGVAYEVWKKVCDKYTTYGALGNVPPADTNVQIDCTGYVSWVFYEYGKAKGDNYLVQEFEGFQHSTTELRTKVDWKKCGFETIPVAGGQDVRDILQPGDVLFRTAADQSTGHAMVVVEVKDGSVYTYDCGNESNWLGKNGNPAINTGFAASDPRAGMIIRKK